MKAFTDYPFEELGDEPYVKAPVREVSVISFDGNKYCRILVDGFETEVKAGYLYTSYGRYGEVPIVKMESLPTVNANNIVV